MKTIKAIKCFAVDHRTISSPWPYPWIRVGTGFTNNCAIRDTGGNATLCTEQFNSLLGEWTAMWWIWKHLSEFGKTDYVGMTQYRRFFTSLQPSYGPFPIATPQGRDVATLLKSIIQPEQLLQICESKSLDGILPTRFPDYSYCTGCKDVVDLMLNESRWLSLGMGRELCQDIFQMLRDFCRSKYSDQTIDSAFKMLSTYHFNMFVLKKHLFEEYCQTIDYVVMRTIKQIEQQNIQGLHPRLFGYVIERLSSSLFFMMQIAGQAKFAECQILLLEKEELKQQ